MQNYYTYIATNKLNTVLYTGITNNLEKRMFEHKNKLILGFTSKYNVNKLIWYENFNSPEEAISAEKKVKGWTRVKKLNLIKLINPNFDDLLINE
ncbi:MAG: GIY-YIG nuclease family protein [Patescibacteria group bacterium]